MDNSRRFSLACFAVFACLLCVGLAAVGGGVTFFLLQPSQTLISAGDDFNATATVLAEAMSTVNPDSVQDPNRDLIPTPMLSPDQAGSHLAISNPVPPEALASEQTLLQAEVPASDPIRLAEQLRGLHNIPRVVTDHADPIALGTLQTFHASNQDTETNYDLTARLRYATAHAYFWVDTSVDASDSEIRALTDKFENSIYPTDREFFGSEWTPGVDGDPHIYILYASGLGSSVGGYFSSMDEYVPAVNQYSNAHEMFYLNADNEALSDSFTAGVLAHEFQHMIHWNQDRNESSWLNEGSSELAVALNKMDLGGFDNIYVNNLNIPLTNWPSISDVNTSPWYGGAFLFLDYFLGRFGTAATQSLIHDPANGMQSIDDTLATLGAVDPAIQKPLTADQLFADFASALLLHDSALQGGIFSFREYADAPFADAGKNAVTKCPSGRQTGSVNQYGIRYIRIRCAGDLTFNFAGQSTQKLLPTEAVEGKYMLWSNRGDESDMTLTHSFDLPTGGATMKYKIWYDLEEGWDYAYVNVSDDGGQTWKMLHSPSGTSVDPQGNSYGWGWTGESGGGKSPQWVEESVDLSAYAGKTVLLRFEYITDAAVNQEGLLVDDIRIPELNYAANFEDGLDGWDAKGFARVQNMVPQTYEVMLIKRGSANTVERLPLDDRSFGSYTFALMKNEDMVVVVVPTSRFSNQLANYQFEVMIRN